MPDPARSAPPLWRDLAHLTLAWCLAVAQPLYGLLGDQPQFLVAQGVTGGRLIGFALAMALAPPAIAALVLYLVRLLWPRAAHWLGNALIATLLALVLLPLASALHPWLAVALAAAGGLALTWARARTAAGRLFGDVFSLAIPVFPLAFVFFSPARELIAKRAAEPAPIVEAAPRPVFLFLFDEFPLVSLLDGDLELDARRYPNFARLAATAAWYRDATTVSEATVIAVPAALTGYFPAGDKLRLAVASQYPRNLFTLLAPSHRLHVHESGTQLCPVELCAPAPAVTAESTLISDLWIVYRHLVLPEAWRAGLASIQDGWTGFAQPAPPVAAEVTDADQMHRQMDWNARLRRFREFVGEISAYPANTFHYYHALLPHAPWAFLPDGRGYAYGEPEGVLGVRPLTDPGPLKHTWYPDPVATDLAHRRHLLQVGTVDTLIGELLDAIEAAGLFDDALIIVAGDHGAAFVPGTSRRAAAPENFAAIAGVPLMVKYPGQTEGRAVGGPARLSDLTPTVLAALGAELPAALDGVSLPQLAVTARPHVRLISDDHGTREMPLERFHTELAAFAADQAARYGSGDFEAAIRPALRADSFWLGQAPEEYTIEQSLVARVRVRNPGLYRGAPAPGFVPAYLRATVEDLTALPQPGRVLVALGGRLVTAAAPFRSPGIEDQFATLLPPEALRSGVPELRFYWQPDAEPARLISLQDPCPEPRLVTDANGPGLVSGCADEAAPLTADAYYGQVGATPRADGLIAISGWSGDTLNGQLPAEVLVFVDGTLAARATPEIERPDVVERFGHESLARAGFLTFVAPETAERAQQVRVIARGSAGASELIYPPAGSPAWPFAAAAAIEAELIPVNFTVTARARLATGDLSREAGPGGYRPGVKVGFDSVQIEPHLLGNWYPSSGRTRWAGKRMALAFALPETKRDLVLEFVVRPFLSPEQLPAQRLEIRAGGRLIHETAIVTRGAHELRVPIPAEVIGEDGLLVLEMDAPDATVPEKLGISADLRRLSFAFEWLRLSAVEPGSD